MKGYYFVTDQRISKAGNISDVKNAVAADCTVIQYRNKHAEIIDFYNEALKCKEICKGRMFLVNDRIDIALAVDADGVHIGQKDMPYDVTRKLIGLGKVIGVTVHNVQEAIEAEKMGANYLGVSPIYTTTTKDDAGAPSGPKLIREIKKVTTIPVVTIGGITLKNAPEVVASGADMVCAISAVVCADNVRWEIEKFQDLFE
ncbi:MAG: thiamine phosphate synthase [bacterium]